MPTPTFTIIPFSGGVTPLGGSESLTGSANYLKALCGGYFLAAQGITGSGGSIINPTGGTPNIPYPINLVVTPAQSGGSTIQDNSFKNSSGWNTIFLNGGTDLQLGVGFSINTITGTITFINYFLQTGDVITGLYFKSS